MLMASVMMPHSKMAMGVMIPVLEHLMAGLAQEEMEPLQQLAVRPAVMEWSQHPRNVMMAMTTVSMAVVIHVLKRMAGTILMILQHPSVEME